MVPPTRAGPSLLETRAGGYALVVDPEQIDAHRFEVASRPFTPLEALRSEEELPTRSDEVERALALWRGDALEDVAGMDFARGEITRLDELRWAATERRVDLLLRLGRHGDAIGAPLRAGRNDCRLRERFHEQLVLALYRSGRQADALRAYEDARQTLIEELGIDPGAELRDLERASSNRTHRWTGYHRRPSPTRLTEPRAEPMHRRGGRRRPHPGSAVAADRPRPRVARLDDLLDCHRALTLTGPAGAGKTRLAIELAAQQTDRRLVRRLQPDR